MNQHATEIAAGAAVLTMSGVDFSYRDRQVLTAIDFEVRAGEVMVLLGPNGAGKSTLVKTISGRRTPQRGTVRVAGGNPVTSPDARRQVGLVPQQLAVYPKLTAHENLCIFARLMGLKGPGIREKAQSTLERVGLGDRAHNRVETFSGGMQRRVNIGAALMHEPKLLVLDEPTVGVDIASRHSLTLLLRELRDQGYAILLTTHDMGEAEALADRVAIMVAGRIRAIGPPDAVVEAAFGRAREVSVTVANRRGAAMAAQDPRLRQLGLVPDESGMVFSGLVDTADPAADQLLVELLNEAAIADDLRVRRPGLDTLLNAHIRSEAA